MAGVVVERLTQLLVARGITIIHPFPVQSYNQGLKDINHMEWALEDYGRPRTLGVIVGTTREVWAPFTQFVQKHEWLRGDSLGLVQHPNPFDEYINICVDEALATLPLSIACTVRNYNDVGTKFVHMTLASHTSGLAFSNKVAGLCVHTTYGPWFSMRSVLCLDLEGPPAGPELRNPCSPELDEQVAVKMKELLSGNRVCGHVSLVLELPYYTVLCCVDVSQTKLALACSST